MYGANSGNLKSKHHVIKRIKEKTLLLSFNPIPSCWGSTHRGSDGGSEIAFPPKMMLLTCSQVEQCSSEMGLVKAAFLKEGFRS